MGTNFPHYNVTMSDIFFKSTPIHQRVEYESMTILKIQTSQVAKETVYNN